MAADGHHLEDGVPVTEIHVGDAGASGSVACHTFIARYNHVAVEVGLRFFFLFSSIAKSALKDNTTVLDFPNFYGDVP